MLPRDTQVPSVFRHVSASPCGPAFERIVNRCASAGALASDSTLGAAARSGAAPNQTTVQIAALIIARMTDSPLAPDPGDGRTVDHGLDGRHPCTVGRRILIA